MGIRFYCPNGHKLNVKSFQAGRRGICPFCGAKIIIPTQSTRKSTKAERRAGRASGQPEPEHEVVLQPEAGAEPAFSAQPAGSPPDLGRGGPVSPSRSAPTESAPQGGTPPRAVPLGFPASAPVAPVQGQAPAGPMAAPGSGAPGGGEPREQPVGPAEARPAQPASVPVAAPAQAAPGPAESGEPPDPLAEAANVVWYVRPPSGGQFGPATSDVMRTWIAEGRVSGDSLVWREGWRDWQEAGKVFPQLSAAEDEFEFGDLGAPESAAKAALGKARAPRSRRRETAQQATIITFLVLAVCLLAGVFVWVVFFYPG